MALVAVQALDTRLDQLAHARDTLPESAQVKALQHQSAALDRELTLAETARADLQRELDKSEADVQLVRDRAARNQSRLDAGAGSPKDLQALQHELASLARRQGELEDLELEVMERAETLDAEVARLRGRRAGLDQTLAEATTARDLALGALQGEATDVGARRDALAPSIGAELLALYTKVRASAGGIGAAELKQRRCGGCQLELNQVDLARIKAAAADEVLRCEECRRILVRTAESGL